MAVGLALNYRLCNSPTEDSESTTGTNIAFALKNLSLILSALHISHLQVQQITNEMITFQYAGKSP